MYRLELLKDNKVWFCNDHNDRFFNFGSWYQILMSVYTELKDTFMAHLSISSLADR